MARLKTQTLVQIIIKKYNILHGGSVGLLVNKTLYGAVWQLQLLLATLIFNALPANISLYMR